MQTKDIILLVNLGILSPRADAFEAFTNALYDWLAARARAAEASPAAREALTMLWDKIRAATRETEALNLDRRLHVLAVFEEIAARGRVL